MSLAKLFSGGIRQVEAAKGFEIHRGLSLIRRPLVIRPTVLPNLRQWKKAQ
jgi:hypothetical protein